MRVTERFKIETLHWLLHLPSAHTTPYTPMLCLLDVLLRHTDSTRSNLTCDNCPRTNKHFQSRCLFLTSLCAVQTLDTSRCSWTANDTKTQTRLWNKKLSHCWDSSRYDKTSDGDRSAYPNHYPECGLCKYYFTNRVVKFCSLTSYVVSANMLNYFKSLINNV